MWARIIPELIKIHFVHLDFRGFYVLFAECLQLTFQDFLPLETY